MENNNSKKYVCKCFYTSNIYLKEYDIHVVYKNQEQFRKQYNIILKQKGCVSIQQFTDVMLQIEKEIERRKQLGIESHKRREIIKDSYVPLHPEIYNLKDEYLTSEFKDLVKLCNQDNVTIDQVIQKVQCMTAERVYSLPVFSKEFCDLFIEELTHFEESDCPKGRPNTMNKYGVLLNELGFDEDFMTLLREKYLTPVSQVLFPDWCGNSLDSHKAFVVKYKLGEDLDLGYHYDNAEVTLNVSLGKDFEGGALYFGDMRNVKIKDQTFNKCEHKPGIGIFHRGQHMHGASAIKSGERYNLIMWIRSSSIRNLLCPMCNNKPELVEDEGFGDGFTSEKIVDVCSLN